MQFKEVFLAENSFGVTKSGNGAGNVRGYKRQTVCSGENLLSASADIGKKGKRDGWKSSKTSDSAFDKSLYAL